jgi:foldase protein PrsA
MVGPVRQIPGVIKVVNPQRRRSLKKIIIPAVIILAALVVWLGYTYRSQAVVATVNGENITKADFYNALEKVSGQETLDRLIAESLIRQVGQKENLLPKPEAVQEEVDKIKAQFPSEDAFQEALGQAKITLDDLKKDTETNLIYVELASKDVKINEEEIKQYFEENKPSLSQPEQVKARHILVKTEKEARDILVELKNGADFTRLAKEKSLDMANKDEGGELGYFPRGVMALEFEEVAFGLPVGQLSEPVKTSHGYHIVEVQDKKAAKDATLADVKDKIIENLKMKKLKSPEQLIQDLKKEAQIDIKMPRYQDLEGK